MHDSSDLVGRVTADAELWPDFLAICDCGGRLAGTRARPVPSLSSRARAETATGVKGRSIPVPYGGWRAKRASLRLPGGANAPCHALVRSTATPPGGLTAEVVDLGRGTPEEFAAHADDLKGRIALVRHELMFVAGTIHRRRKYLAARERGCGRFPNCRAAAGAVGRGLIGPAGRGRNPGSRHRARDGGCVAAYGAGMADGHADHRDRGAPRRDAHAPVRYAGSERRMGGSQRPR